MHRMMSDKRTIFLMMAPGFAVFFAIVFIPVFVSLFYSFTDWDGISAYRMVGLHNYRELLLHDPVFWKALRNAFLLGGAFLLIQHPLAVATAMILQYCGRAEKALRTILFIPSIISGFVTSKMWVQILSTQFGLLNRLLDAVGLSTWRQDWLGSSSWAIASIIFVAMWQGFGYAFLLYYTGVKGIPQDLHEAARLDGATAWQLNTRIVLPLLQPVIRTSIILAFIAAFKQMDTVYLMTQGGPDNSTQFLATYLYQKAFSINLYGYANAISVLFIIVCLLVTAALNRMGRQEVGEF
ncbi:carbohydrate ABC transporter permease [Paenibacillus glycinis]|uniref:ABC transporter permease subunit n=1 Tax=Paenibacillus glycinis TaxID=2697035 RepID=A0ABW9XSZ1_9BACL|nr:sugar ABC transporter permease [Paenibacillus glycinis]NBD25764.1 ABC transporter permease subunit [Paenibacillus glycinis]